MLLSTELDEARSQFPPRAVWGRRRLKAGACPTAFGSASVHTVCLSDGGEGTTKFSLRGERQERGAEFQQRGRDQCGFLVGVVAVLSFSGVEREKVGNRKDLHPSVLLSPAEPSLIPHPTGLSCLLLPMPFTLSGLLSAPSRSLSEAIFSD